MESDFEKVHTNNKQGEWTDTTTVIDRPNKVMQRSDTEIKNCVFVPEDGEQDAMLTINENGLNIKLCNYAIIPKSEYKNLMDGTTTFPIFLTSGIIILVILLVLYSFTF